MLMLETPRVARLRSSIINTGSAAPRQSRLSAWLHFEPPWIGLKDKDEYAEIAFRF
jgi:hypothetical protein